MTSERLAGLRRLTEHCAYHDEGNDLVGCTCAEPLNARPLLTELLTHIDELTRQRDDARRIAIDSGAFQNIGGTAYLPDVHLNEEDKWRADPVGPVAWSKPIEQT
jgi:hypothetical protein